MARYHWLLMVPETLSMRVKPFPSKSSTRSVQGKADPVPDQGLRAGGITLADGEGEAAQVGPKRGGAALMMPGQVQAVRRGGSDVTPENNGK